MSPIFRGDLMLSCLLSITVLFPALTAAADWTKFRGPTGQGYAEASGLPTHWSDTENVTWKRPLPGEGWSSPVVHQGVVYVTAAVPVADNDEGDFSLRLLAMRADSGRHVFDVEIFAQSGADSPKIHPKNSHASPTPIVAGGRIYVHFGHQGTACLDLAGKKIWENRDLKYPPFHGGGGSLVLVDGRLIFSCDGERDPFVAALDSSTGNVLWRVTRETDASNKFSFSTPLVVEVDGQTQVISPGSNAVCAYDPKTGNEIWRVTYKGYSVVPTPVFGHGLLFIVTGHDKSSVMAIRLGGQGDVTDTHVVWTVTRSAPHTPSLLLVGDELYMISDRGIGSCLDAKTGQPHWQQRIGGAFSASPLFADGKIFLQNEEGVGYVLKAGKRFQQIGKNDLKERTLASYAVADNALFIRSDRHLYRIESR